MTKKVLVFPMEDMLRGFAALSYLIGRGKGFNINRWKDHKYSSLETEEWTYIPDKLELQKLGKILQHDIKFYQRAKEMYKKEYKGWKP